MGEHVPRPPWWAGALVAASKPRGWDYRGERVASIEERSLGRATQNEDPQIRLP